MADKNYSNFTRPYDHYLNRSPNDPTFDQYEKSTDSGVDTGSPSGNTSGGANNADNNGNTENQPVKDNGSLGDVWINTFIKSTNWKPKTTGFYIDGQTGYAEFQNVYIVGNVHSQTGSIGGFEIGYDYIRDIANTFGLASTNDPAHQVNLPTDPGNIRFWAGAPFNLRYSAPFQVFESGWAKIAGFYFHDTWMNDIADQSVGLATDSPLPLGQNIRIWAGSSYANRDITAPFRVYDNGEGRFAGFKFFLNHVSDLADSFGMSSDSSQVYPGNVTFWAGSTFANRLLNPPNPLTPPFKVYENGFLYSAYGSIGGFLIQNGNFLGNNIEIDSSGFIKVGDIAGPTTRIEINGVGGLGEIYVYNASNQKVGTINTISTPTVSLNIANPLPAGDIRFWCGGDPVAFTYPGGPYPTTYIFGVDNGGSVILKQSGSAYLPSNFYPGTSTIGKNNATERFANMYSVDATLTGTLSANTVSTSSFSNSSKSTFNGSVVACPLPTVLNGLEIIRKIPEPTYVGDRGHYGDGLYFDDLTFPEEVLYEIDGVKEIEHTHMIGLLMQAVRELTQKVDILEAKCANLKD